VVHGQPDGDGFVLQDSLVRRLAAASDLTHALHNFPIPFVPPKSVTGQNGNGEGIAHARLSTLYSPHSNVIHVVNASDL